MQQTATRCFLFILLLFTGYTVTAQTVSFVSTTITVAETTATVNITARLTNGNASPSSVSIELLPIGTASAGSDFVAPIPATFTWPANSNNVDVQLNFTINNDADQESTEYFMVRFINAVNLTLPAAASNHCTVFISDDDKTAPVASNAVQLTHIASFSNGASGSNSAEIVAHDPSTQRLYIANSIGGKLDIINFSNPASASLISSIPITSYGNINSVAVRNGIVAVAIENASPQLNGKVVFFDANGTFQKQVDVGAMPDMIVFNNAGTRVLTANEGEPNAAYTSDPEGSVSVIDISGGIAGLTQSNVTTIDFTSFNSQAATLKASGIRLFGPAATVAQDIEPEYITISSDDQTAWVTCQENNAIAVVNLNTNTITALRPLGTKDHMVAGNALDVSDNTSAIHIANWPVKGLYMPDAIATYTVGGQTYLVTANEGDSREYTGYSEVNRLSSASYVLDPTAFPYADVLKAQLGRLNVTRATGNTDGDGDFDEIHVFGTRSFSIWNATTGTLVWDSGDQLELITSKHPTFGALFNASNSNNTLKNRSDDKGPEPEGITIATIWGRVFAFIALERIGGCMVYEITNPANPVFVDYKNTRNTGSYGGDNGAEGIIYISAANSPTGIPIVILANEVSSTLTFFSVNTSALSVRMGDITATNNGAVNVINWHTLSEDKGDAFEIERGSNGIQFEKIGMMNAKGTATAYRFTDAKPIHGINYYRLKIKDINGSISYSPIVSANYQIKDNAFSVYPNPANKTIKIIINEGLMNGTLEIRNAAGVLLMQQPMKSTQTDIDISNFPSGVLYIRIISANQTRTRLINKQ